MEITAILTPPTSLMGLILLKVNESGVKEAKQISPSIKMKLFFYLMSCLQLELEEDAPFTKGAPSS